MEVGHCSSAMLVGWILQIKSSLVHIPQLALALHFFKLVLKSNKCWVRSVWLEWAILCTLGNHSKPVAAIILPKSSTLLGKGVEIVHFYCEIIFGQLVRQVRLIDIWRFLSGHTAQQSNMYGMIPCLNWLFSLDLS